MDEPLLPAFSLSLRIASLATLIAVVVALPLAAVSARRRFRGRSMLDALLMLPLVLPPTVLGYLLLVLLGRRGWLGQWLHAWFDYTLVFRVEAAVLAATVVAFPLIYLPAKSGMSAISREMLDTAHIYGASRWQVFWHVLVPLARKGILAGTVLGFARALGEFGATLMVLGWQPGRTTLPILVYAAAFEPGGQLSDAAVPVATLCVVSLVVVVAYNAMLQRDE